MKIIADEMISSKIVNIINSVETRRNFKFVSVIGSAYQSRPDVDWIDAFSQDGGKGILSADRKMLRKKSLIRGISKLGLTAIYLPHNWANSRIYKQAAYILFHWPFILENFSKSPKGTIWTASKGFSELKLKQVKIKKKK